VRVLFLTDAEVAALLPYGELIDALATAFAGDATAPLRSHHALDAAGEALLLMPAWQAGGRFGAKLATVCPANSGGDLPVVQAVYVLGDVVTGRFLATFAATELTRRRTAATSALASRMLSRPDARRLLVVGTGALVPHLVAAHCAVRPVAEIALWGRRHDRAAAVAARLRPGDGIAVHVADELSAAVTWADVVTCATSSQEALVRGEWLRPGQHLDLVGSYLSTMREVDDRAVQRSSIYVDSHAAALAEAGDLVIPLRTGAIERHAIRGDLAEIVRGAAGGRRDAEEITLFKSVGLAVEDLAAATLAFERAQGMRA
jgi:ornithine cyclodeaminase